jgi:CO/xanthine dehydrogenase Mo-binding subunit
MPEEFKGRNQDRKEFKIVGKKGIPGRHSYAIATGLAKFPRDIIIPGMLFAKVLRSPHGRARIKSLDTSAAEKLPGVKAVIRWDDPEIKAMPPLSLLGNYGATGTAPVLDYLADREGDEVGAVVAAESEEICEEALKLIKVEWEILPHIIDAKADAPILHPELNLKDNTGGQINWEDGNAEAAFKKAENIAEFDFSWGNLCHHRPNPTTSIAYWEQDPNGTEGKTLVVDCPQHIPGTGPQHSASMAFDLPQDKVHQLTPFWGGKYCGFTGWRSEALAPLLAKRTGRPVRYDESRRDDFDIGFLSSYPKVKIGFDKDGIITAVQGDIVAGIGARCTSANEYITSMQAFRSTKCKDIKQNMRHVYTSTMRQRTMNNGMGYENPAKAFYVIADKLNMDPTAVALKNCHTPEPSLKLCIDNGKKAINWQWHAAGAKKQQNGKMHGYGFRYFENTWNGKLTYTAALCIADDGKVYMPYSEALVGTHWEDAFAMVIAEELGAKIEDVNLHFVPNLPFYFKGTARDRGPSGCWVVKEAAIDLKAKLIAAAAAALKVQPEELDTKDSTVYLIKDPAKAYPFKQFGDVGASDLASCYIGHPPACQGPKVLTAMNALFCEVEVDTETGEVDITQWVCVADGGKVIRPDSFEGQIEQGIIYTSSIGKVEEVIWDPATGVKLNASTLEYKPPCLLDTPPMNISTVDTRTAAGAYGSSGITHAINDRISVHLAVWNAIGKWIDSPITPAKVLAALGKI